MGDRIVTITALVLMPLLLVESPRSAAEPVIEPPLRILVTIDNGSERNSVNKPAAARSYRYRLRYKVSVAAQRHARAVATQYELKQVDDWPIASLNVYCVVYEPAKSASLSLLLQQLSSDSRVESAQQMHHFESMALPTVAYNDSYAGLQYGLDSMDVSAAHKLADGKGVSIAVIDGGVDLQHEDFLGSRLRSRNFVPAGHRLSSTAHGTAVVSLIVARPNNSKGIVGVAPAAELTAIRACWSSDNSETARCDSFTLAKAMDYLVRSPPDLINFSIAGPRDPLLGRLIDRALRNGTVIVAARPNSVTAQSAYPAGFAGVVAVGAAPAGHDETAARTAPTDTILAPGEQIMVALPDDRYDFRSGSSLAAANASGVIALLLERVPDLDGARIAHILRESQAVNRQGAGVINACRALAEIDTANTCY